MRRIICEKVDNMRDLGGYMTKYNLETKFNRFIRSNLPEEMATQEINYLKDNNFTTVIDLRAEFEIKNQKNALNNENFDFYNIDFLEGYIPDFKNLQNFKFNFPDMYMNLLNNKNKMRAILDIIINAKGNVLFNCTAGKDRTGVIAMVLLLTAGVYEIDIIADYAVSEIYLNETIKIADLKGLVIPAYHGSSKAEYMLETLKIFKEKYNNIDDYLKYIGLNEDNIKNLRNKMLS